MQAVSPVTLNNRGEIAPGIYQLKVPIPNNHLGNLLAYFIPHQAGGVLVDTGWYADSAWAELLRQLNLLGWRQGQPLKVLLTHLHPDHYGLVHRLRPLGGIEVMALDQEVAVMTARLQDQNFTDQLAQWLRIHGAPPEEIAPLYTGPVLTTFTPPAIDRILHPDDVIPAGDYQLEVIPTPGHSPGHACFWDSASRILLAGDHLLPVTTPNISLLPGNNANPLGDYLISLQRVASLEPELVLPGHEYAYRDLKTRVTQILEHHNLRLQETLAALAGKQATAYQLATQLSWAIGSWDRLQPWDQRAAVLETIAHLEYMGQEGVVAREETGEMVEYAVRD